MSLRTMTGGSGTRLDSQMTRICSRFLRLPLSIIVRDAAICIDPFERVHDEPRIVRIQ